MTLVFQFEHSRTDVLPDFRPILIFQINLRQLTDYGRRLSVFYRSAGGLYAQKSKDNPAKIYKSVKRLELIRFVVEDEPGFYERGGYSNFADPWKEERFD